MGGRPNELPRMGKVELVSVSDIWNLRLALCVFAMGRSCVGSLNADREDGMQATCTMLADTSCCCSQTPPVAYWLACIPTDQNPQ